MSHKRNDHNSFKHRSVNKFQLLLLLYTTLQTISYYIQFNFCRKHINNIAMSCSTWGIWTFCFKSINWSLSRVSFTFSGSSDIDTFPTVVHILWTISQTRDTLLLSLQKQDTTGNHYLIMTADKVATTQVLSTKNTKFYT